MKHSYLTCPSCGNEVTSLTRVCRCGHVFQAATPSWPSGKTAGLHHFVLMACRALCLTFAVIAPFLYLFAAAQSGNFLLVLAGLISAVFLLGSFYLFKAVQIIIDRDQEGRW